MVRITVHDQRRWKALPRNKSGLHILSHWSVLKHLLLSRDTVLRKPSVSAYLYTQRQTTYSCINSYNSQVFKLLTRKDATDYEWITKEIKWAAVQSPVFCHTKSWFGQELLEAHAMTQRKYGLHTTGAHRRTRMCSKQMRYQGAKVVKQISTIYYFTRTWYWLVGITRSLLTHLCP